MTTEQDRAAAHEEWERERRVATAAEMIDADERYKNWQATAGQEFPHLLDIEGPSRFTETE